MWRDGTFIPKEKVQFTFNSGGAGDMIAAMSCIKWVKDTYKFVDIHLFVPDFFVELANNLVPGITVRKYSEVTTYWNDKVPAKQLKNIHTQMKTHVVDHAFHVLADREARIEEKNYCRLTPVDISNFCLPKDYVCIPVGYTARVREMVPETVNGIVEYLLSKNITPVFLGSKTAPTGVKTQLLGNFNTDIDYTKGIDLIDKTTLPEVGTIMGNALAVVGLDCGLLHLAGTTSVPIVFGTTTVESHLRVPYRDNVLGKNCYVVEPPKSLKCRFCQSNWDYIYSANHDFKLCYYKDYKCTKELSADKYIKFLELIL